MPWNEYLNWHHCKHVNDIPILLCTCSIIKNKDKYPCNQVLIYTYIQTIPSGHMCSYCLEVWTRATYILPGEYSSVSMYVSSPLVIPSKCTRVVSKYRSKTNGILTCNSPKLVCVLSNATHIVHYWPLCIDHKLIMIVNSKHPIHWVDLLCTVIYT